MESVRCRQPTITNSSGWYSSMRFVPVLFGGRLRDAPIIQYNTLHPWNGGIFRSRPDIRVDVSPTRGSNFWGPREKVTFL